MSWIKDVTNVTPIPAPLYEPTFSIGDQVRAILSADPKAYNAFSGRSKRQGDTSDAGYDWWLLERLVDGGVRDPVELVTACRWRACYQMISAEAQSALVKRLSAQVSKILAAADAAATGAPAIDHLVIYQSSPPAYEVHGASGAFVCTMQELMSPTLFARRYAEAFRVIPTMPKKADKWAGIVNEWLANADVHVQPEDATEDGHALEVLRAVLRSLPLCDDPNEYDLGRGCAVLRKDGSFVVSLKAVLSRANAELPKLTASDLGRHFRVLGYTPEENSVRIGGKTVRVWVAPKDHLHRRDEAKGSPNPASPP